jgi:autotransporter translocation and assembly factor TamB
MMRAIRRSLQVVALVGTLMVGIIAVTLIVSQTPWFRDWLRRFVVRESKQYLNGELSIGRLSGNLFFGIGLDDVSLDVSGQHVVAIKSVKVDYDIRNFFSSGIVLDDLTLVGPQVHLERTVEGWNVGKLVKAQKREADRKGPARPISLPLIDLQGGTMTIDDRQGSTSYRLPQRIDDLNAKLSFEYAPVHYTVGLDRVSFRASSPQLTMQSLTGVVSVRDDNLYLEKIAVRTGQSSVDARGVVQQYLQTPNVQITGAGTVSLPEIAGVLPAVSGYAVTPTFDVKTAGPFNQMGLDLDVRSEVGHVRGKMTADFQSPDIGARGEADLERFNLAPIVRDPKQPTDVTGHAIFDVTLASEPSRLPAADRVHATYTFSGPRAVAFGYQAAAVKVKGKVEGRRISFDGRADAYRASATARGSITLPAERRPLTFDIQGSANHVDLRALPPSARAPKLESNLDVAEYHVQSDGRTISGSATLHESQIEGATLADGTAGTFSTDPHVTSYSAHGSATNLDLQRVGRVFQIDALTRPEFEGRINTSFDVTGSGTTAAALQLDAKGTMTESTGLGTRFPLMDYEAHLDRGALRTHAEGSFEGLDPSRLTGRPQLEGIVNGTINANVQFADVNAPMTTDSVSGGGTIHITKSSVGGLDMERADLQANYASQIADVASLSIEGPDLKATAAGKLALDRTSASNLKYHIDATNLTNLAQLADVPDVAGSAVLDGTVTGNMAALQTEGTLKGSDLAYQQNNALTVDSRYAVTVPDLDFVKAKVQATTGATFVKAFGLEINELSATTTYAGQQLAFKTNIKEKTRELDATGDVIFHPDHQEIHLPDLALRTQGIEWRTPPGSSAAIQYGGDELTLQGVQLVSGDQTLEASGSLALKGEGKPGALEIRARNVDVAQLERLSLQNRGFSGRLGADVIVSGSIAQPVGRARAQVTGGGFQGYRYDWLKADLGYQGTRIFLDTTLQQTATESVTVNGSVPTSLFKRSEGGHIAPSAGDEVDLIVRTTAINLGFVQGFTKAITNVTGTLQANVHVTGSGEDPHFQGFVDIKGGGFGIPASGVSYTGLDTRVELRSELVRIPQLYVVDEEGHKMTVAGELSVHSGQVGAVNINIDSTNFEVIDNELGDIGVDSRLKVTGELRRPKVEGDIRFEAARLEVDKILALFYDPYSVEALPDVTVSERAAEAAGSAQEAARSALAESKVRPTEPSAQEEAPQPTSGFVPVELDIKLRIPDNMVIRGKSLRPGGRSATAIGDVNVTVGGDLEIRKAPNGPVTLFGAIQPVRGTYSFQGRRFDLVRDGSIRFTGEPTINPILDVSATRDIPNTGIQARVHITGTVRAPQLELSSTPPLDESDILSLIVFNRPVNELGTGERTSLATTAGGIAGGFLAAPLGESIGRALDLDLFEITTTTEAGELGAGVTVGQQIGDRTFFKLRQEFGDRSVTEFQLEYQLSRFLRFQGSAAPETSGSANRIGQRRIEKYGIDLIFFFSY